VGAGYAAALAVEAGPVRLFLRDFPPEGFSRPGSTG